MQEYKFSLKGMMKFSLISLYGRIFLNKSPDIRKDSKNYLNLGCGLNIIESSLDGGGF